MPRTFSDWSESSSFETKQSNNVLIAVALIHVAHGIAVFVT